MTKNLDVLSAADKGNGQSADGTRVTVGDWTATAYWSEKFGRAVPVVIRAGNGEFPRQIEVRDLITAAGGKEPLAALPVFTACAEACRIAADPALSSAIKQKAQERKDKKAGKTAGPLTNRVKASDAAAALNAA